MGALSRYLTSDTVHRMPPPPNSTTQRAAHVIQPIQAYGVPSAGVSSTLCAGKEHLMPGSYRVSLKKCFGDISGMEARTYPLFTKDFGYLCELSPAPATLPVSFSNVRWTHHSTWSGPARFLLVPRLPKLPDCHHANNFVMWQVPARPSVLLRHFLTLRPFCVSHNSTRQRDAQHFPTNSAPICVFSVPTSVRRSYCAATKQFRHRSRVHHPLLHAFMFLARLRVMIRRICREPSPVRQIR
ncbi:hypothetical protein JMJ77_0003084 [Colletotrichum scovillei]|uniref:Uncharacterized protein n=1 Tax=Colletotrichum scovillei TaxID=1209932 RepID=A0A9P7U7N7_9PEZI|nr:hypothetical protein JMJ78_0006291 [Colletotrichum scovillei]KAG7043378.1 hypothetical protein JMJ77_0003084 [Colletotrichum scovillei]KAG7062826.1 hypothetical protein JMJ76_0009669 [Colletotrichum scovillei]